MVMPEYSKRRLGILLITLLLGAAIGTLFGDLVGMLLPDGVVRQFFLQSVSWGMSPVSIDLLVLSLTFGFRVKFSISSILGLGVVYYMMRYFR